MLMHSLIGSKPIWLSGVLPSFSREIARWMERRKQRRYLATLDARLLNDIGVSESARENEIAKPFWQDSALGVVSDRRSKSRF